MLSLIISPSRAIQDLRSFGFLYLPHLSVSLLIYFRTEKNLNNCLYFIVLNSCLRKKLIAEKCGMSKFLTEGKIDLSKLKAFADDKVNDMLLKLLNLFSVG